MSEASNGSLGDPRRDDRSIPDDEFTVGGDVGDAFDDDGVVISEISDEIAIGGDVENDVFAEHETATDVDLATTSLDDALTSDSLQRLSKALFATALAGFVRAWIVPIIVFVYFSKSDGGLPWWVWASVGAAGLTIIATTLLYMTFRYGVVGDQLVVRQGILFRKMRTVPIGRIQNIHLERDVLNRMFGVSEVRIETAGSGSEPEIHLPAVGRREAESFRTDLLARKAGVVAASVEQVEPDPGDVVLRSRVSRLLLAGATETRVGVMVAGLWGLFEFFDDLGDRFRQPIVRTFETIVGNGTFGAVIAGVLIVILFLLAGWLISIVFTLVNLFGFRLRRISDELHKSHGLLTKFHGTVPLHRIQVVRMQSNPLRRWLGWHVVITDTAGSTQGRESARTNVVAPLVRASEADDLSRRILDDYDIAGTKLLSVHPLARRRGFIRYMFDGVLLAALAAIGMGPWAFIALLPWAPFAWFLACVRYRALGYATSSRYIVARSGLWTWRRSIVPQRKIQSVGVTQSPLQRWYGLADLELKTAASGTSRSVNVVDVDAEKAHSLFESLSVASAAAASLSDGV